MYERNAIVLERYFDSAFGYDRKNNLKTNFAEYSELVKCLEEYKNVYNPDDDRQAWFDKIKELCPKLNFCADTKEYKANPDAYKGSAGDLSTILRIAVTGRRNTPDLCSIMQVLGVERCFARIDKMINSL